MPLYSANNAKPSNRAGQDATTRDRGMTDYFDMRKQPNKAKVQDGRLVMMQNAAGQHARRAPKVDILR
tara:strand:+ start:19071 stop:19274 length:204 start_codon:yes stop_codon:yes gene_type:complete